MKIAINQHHRGKMPVDLPAEQTKRWWRTFNGQFKNFDLPSTEQIIWSIQEGFALTAQHSGYRKRDNFICGQHIGLDFDTENEYSSIETLRKNKFIESEASFIHTTHSHTKERPRSRVIFILERPLYARRKYTLLAKAFVDKFPFSDPSCKDPTRIFFGAKDCTAINLGNILTFEKAAEVVVPFKEKITRITPVEPRELKQLNGDIQRLIDSLLDKVANAPDGHKWHTLCNVSRAVGGYVGAGYFNEDTAHSMLIQAIMPRADDIKTANEAISWGLKTGKQDPLYLEEDLDSVIQALF